MVKKKHNKCDHLHLQKGVRHDWESKGESTMGGWRSGWSGTYFIFICKDCGHNLRVDVPDDARHVWDRLKKTPQWVPNAPAEVR